LRTAATVDGETEASETIVGFVDEEAAGSADARSAAEEVMSRRADVDVTMAIGVDGDGSESASGGEEGLR
jgi:hypothetical protein